MSFRKFRFFFYFSLATLLFLGVERLCHKATDGFAVTRITHSLQKPSVSWSAPSVDITSVLSQPFTYLASGAQSYVFESEDGLYVLKFFKFHHLRIPQWISALPLPSFLQAYKTAKVEKKQRLLDKTFQSYVIAAELLPQETALAYLHLSPTTDLKQKIHLIDKIGIHYFLQADSLAFILQRKGFSFYQKLLEEIQQGCLSQAKENVSSLLALSLERCKKGIGDLDPDFSTNFGYIDGHVVQLDIGRFYLEEKEKDPEVYKRELYRITRSLKAWLQIHSPELAYYLDEELLRIKGESVF